MSGTYVRTLVDAAACDVEGKKKVMVRRSVDSLAALLATLCAEVRDPGGHSVLDPDSAPF
jgi:hypothetical protein